MQQQLAGVSEASGAGPKLITDGSLEEPSQPLPFLELPYFNGQGGFTKDGREYAIYLKPGDNTPAPGSNVMANPSVRRIWSAKAELGFTWRRQQSANRLTPCEKTTPSVTNRRKSCTSAMKNRAPAGVPRTLPIRESDAYRIRHGQGYSVFEHNSHAIGQELAVFVPVKEDGTGEPVKIFRLRLRNDSSRSRKLSVTYFASLVLGGNREDNQLHIHTSRDEQTGALFAGQYWKGTYSGHVTFASCNPAPSSYSGDRTQFLGRNRIAGRPAALEHHSPG